MKLPKKTIQRLSRYRRLLLKYQYLSDPYIYSHDLARLLNLNPVQVRRDLMLIGSSGNHRKGYNVNESDIMKGLKSVNWRGRYERIEDNLICDCAHNAKGAKILATEIQKEKYDRLIMVIGILKDYDGFLLSNAVGCQDIESCYARSCFSGFLFFSFFSSIGKGLYP